MGVTTAVELWADWSSRTGGSFLWLYHIFVIIEYVLLCWYFFTATVSKSLRIGIVCSVPIFIAGSLWVSHTFYGFEGFPGHNINAEGLLVWIMCTGVMFNLDTRQHARAVRHPDFWIVCGWLVFFVGTFFSNGLLNLLIAHSKDDGLRIFTIFNRPLNLILYSCLTVGFICAIRRT